MQIQSNGYNYKSQPNFGILRMEPIMAVKLAKTPGASLEIIQGLIDEQAKIRGIDVIFKYDSVKDTWSGKVWGHNVINKENKNPIDFLKDLCKQATDMYNKRKLS